MNKTVISKTLKVTIAATFCLIALGGATRAMNAGLACPDWPLCFGDLIPDLHFQVYYEFIHRAVAGLVSLGTLALTVMIFRGREVPAETKKVMGLAIVILLAQIVLGGLTVLKLLNFAIVTAHLAFGVAFFACLVWMLNSVSQLKVEKKHKMPTVFFVLPIVAALAVYGQILLGGLVSTNYAGLACPDFPLCNGEFMPVLVGPIGLQVIHRLGAYIVAILLVSIYLYVSKHRETNFMSRQYFNSSGLLVLLILVQIAVGATNVLAKIPPVVTVVHLAIAVSILALTIRLLFIARLQKAE